MKEHYNEADLLETYYMQPGEASEIIAHVNRCSECQDRYRRLAQKLRDVSACPADKPETFWMRQRMIIGRAVERVRREAQPAVRVGRVAAAAMLAFILGGAIVYKSVEHKRTAVAIVSEDAVMTPSEDDDLTLPRDPWQSDDLKEFSTVVAWQSWRQ